MHIIHAHTIYVCAKINIKFLIIFNDDQNIYEDVVQTVHSNDKEL